MSRSYKHTPVNNTGPSERRCLKKLAVRRARQSAPDTIGYLSDEDGDPLLGRASRVFTRAYRGWDIHEEQYRVSRNEGERDYQELLRDGVARMWGDEWEEAPRSRIMYRLWARRHFWK